MRLGCCGILTEEDGPKRLCDSSASISGSSSVSNVLRKEADAKPILNKRRILKIMLYELNISAIYSMVVMYQVPEIWILGLLGCAMEKWVIGA